MSQNHNHIPPPSRHVTSIWSAREFAEDVVLTPEQIEKSFALTDLFGKKGWNVAKSEFSGLGESPLAVAVALLVRGA